MAIDLLCRSRVGAALVAALTGISLASAQTLEWELPVYTQVPYYDGGDATMPWQSPAAPTGGLIRSPFFPETSLKRRIMLTSSAGEPGVVLAGAAQTGPIDVTFMPRTPWITKISMSSGQVLWTWHPLFNPPFQGGFWEAAADSAGNVVAVGTRGGSDAPTGLLLIKLDGASGSVLWRVDGPPHSWGYSVTFDPSDDVLATGTVGASQRVTKFSGSTGEELWSASLSSASTSGDDLLIATNASGEVAVTGHYETDNPHVEAVRVARLRGSDGGVIWDREFTGPYWSWSKALRLLPDGDVVIAGNLSDSDRIARLSGQTGETFWERGDVEPRDLAVDPGGNLVAIGDYSSETDPSYSAADIQRIDATSGETIWRRQIGSDSTFTYGGAVAIGTDGNPIVGMQQGELQAAAGLDLATGAVRWFVRPPQDGYDDETNHKSRGIFQAPDGRIYFSGIATPSDDSATWTVFRLAPIAADTIFMNGYD